MNSIALPKRKDFAAYRATWVFAAALCLLILQALQATAQMMPNTFADLADEISPSVVNITTTTVIAGRADQMPRGIVPKGSPFEEFFREFEDRRRGGNGGASRSSALGSGFVISADGFIVTNNHVIEGADEIEVEFFSGERLAAKVIGTDKNTDIAVLKVASDAPLPFVSFGDSDTARVGDWVVAMGNPLGQGFSVSAGIVSARNRALSGIYDDYIQTDAAINRGNSGGPLFNLDGEVVGVNTAILSPNGGSIGIGFSMASNVVSRVVDQLTEYGEIRRGWLGVRIQDVDEDIAESIDGLDRAAGAVVTGVPEGPSKDAGILQGDVIVIFDGHEVEDVRDLVQTVGNTEVGKAVDVVVVRDGAQVTLSVTLGLRDDEKLARADDPAVNEDAPKDYEDLGITLSNLTDEIREGLDLAVGLEGVVVVDVVETSEAFEKGLKSGDVIVEAGQEKVTSLAEFEEQVSATIESGRKTMLLLVRRGGDPRFLALTVQQ
ncbi:MAG: Do family serine endopeptidase [Planktomarina temperata]|nr:Do family serine endopeptidase [Planktomarina temperata]